MARAETDKRVAESAALKKVTVSREEMTTSKERWTQAVLDARHLGISNVRIAAACNLSETAIRLLVSRAEPDLK